MTNLVDRPTENKMNNLIDRPPENKMTNLIDGPSANRCQEYRQKCFALYKALRNPNIKYSFNPPARAIPKELLANFTQNGFMLLGK